VEGCAKEKTVHLTIDDMGSTVTLHTGDVLEIALPMIFGTGYSWKVAENLGNVSQGPRGA
jgi:hypothetical protein